MTTITSKFTKERLIDWAVVAVAERVRDLKDAPESVEAAANLKLAEIALASLTAEPVAWKYRLVDINSGTGEHWKYSTQCITPTSGKTHCIESVPLYTVPPASERERIRREHAEWSDATFGDISPIGPLKHLSKEALEAAADPSDPLEWADMQFLLWDAQRRMGLSDEFITRAMVEKLAINKSRQWPEPKDGEPRMHIKEQPVPVVPEEITSTSAPEVFEIAAEAERIGLRGSYASYAVGWNACRAAMLQGSQPVSKRDELPVQ
ncbi:TPA_asm: DUF550 domain-containing protein [Salmonella enterica]|nr:DUF550 domain-containing protein [Salmonella enterica]